MAPRARFELARERSHGLSRPAQYQAMRPRLGPSNRLPVFTMTILVGGLRSVTPPRLNQSRRSESRCHCGLEV